MKNTLVIGSGISGLTMALLLAQRGRKVILVEKLPFIGGYLNRFSRNGFRFDTGLHFTGGFGNVLSDMLEILNLQDVVKPAPIRTNVVLADYGCDITLPSNGIPALEEALSAYFP